MKEPDEYHRNLDTLLRRLNAEIERDLFSVVNQMPPPPPLPWYRFLYYRFREARHWLARKIDPWPCDCGGD